jgi:hypothetical protein
VLGNSYIYPQKTPKKDIVSKPNLKWENLLFSFFSFFFSFFSFFFFPQPPKGQNLPSAARFEFQGVRTRPMNPKRLSSVLVCTHHLRGLTDLEEYFTFWEEYFTFLHGVFPYIRNPSFSTQESVQVSWLSVVFDPAARTIYSKMRSNST